MPIIDITMVESPRETKEQLVQELTSHAARITGIEASHFTVTIKELGHDNIGVNGRTVRAIYADLAEH